MNGKEIKVNDPIRPDQEDRYTSPNSPQKPQPEKLETPILSKTKWIILILALIIILVLVGTALIKPTLQQPSSQSSAQSGGTDETTTNGTSNNEYQVLTPPKISTTATESQQTAESGKERIEIPGEVIDILANKINELNTQQTDSVAFSGQNISTDLKQNELPLEKTLDNNHYTIQINSSSSIENLLDFVKQNKLTNYQIYETYRENKPWFVLIKGNYSTIADAKQTISSLSLELQKSRPWIKSGELVNKEKSLK